MGGRAETGHERHQDRLLCNQLWISRKHFTEQNYNTFLSMPQESSQETTNVSYLTVEAESGCLLPEEDYLQWQTEAIP